MCRSEHPPVLARLGLHFVVAVRVGASDTANPIAACALGHEHTRRTELQSRWCGRDGENESRYLRGIDCFENVSWEEGEGADRRFWRLGVGGILPTGNRGVEVPGDGIADCNHSTCQIACESRSTRRRDGVAFVSRHGVPNWSTYYIYNVRNAVDRNCTRTAGKQRQRPQWSSRLRSMV